jgi:hypothetical protein
VTRPANPRDGRWPSPGSGGGRLPAGERGSWPTAREDDAWGPSTAVYSSAAAQAAPAPGRSGRGFRSSPAAEAGTKGDDEWAASGPRSAREQRAVRAADKRTERSVQALTRGEQAHERGLPWWGALLVLLGIALIGGIIDTIGSLQSKSGFNIGIVVASVVAIIVVKRSHMFPVVIAPPIVYSAAAVFEYYLKGHKTSAKLDIAANYLVYGFPAMAAATAAVLIVAGVRLISRK